MTRTALGIIGLVALTAGACTDTVSGQAPVGGDEPSVAEQERYARRLHLDLTAAVPTDADQAAVIDRLATDGNSAATRMAIADELIDSDAFGEAFVSELENAVFAGGTLEDQYQFYCGVIRSNSAYPDCNACAPNADPCAACDCYMLTELLSERADLRTAAADIASGARTTGEIDRAYGGSQIFRFTTGNPATAVTVLFENFLGRPAEPEELLNGANMVQGALLGETFPAGLLFHRHGSNYADLVDIVFSDEAYREAVVTKVFERYLGRTPTPAELIHFTNEIDAAEPDARPIIRAVVSSREYFEQ